MNSPRSVPLSYRFDWIRCLLAERRARVAPASPFANDQELEPRPPCSLRPLSQLLDDGGRRPLRAPCLER